MGVRLHERTTALITVAVVVTLIVAILIAVSRASGPGRDARAYPADRGTISLTGALARSHLVVPDCLTHDLGYAVPGPSHDLYLQVNGNESCMDRFLGLNRLAEQDAPLVLPDWAVDGRAAALGWTIDAQGGLVLYTAAPAPDHHIDALVHALSDGSAVTAYVRAT
ncbi:hypothetical protein [Catenuloplanes japonicus]|uniref:hypothetical protein n=1 Tax=Catenuloplanes japonicus TaxID=33876 RepID=UPI0012FA92B2|nr:hypothetical protein [Catenuloplanes japonicus]